MQYTVPMRFSARRVTIVLGIIWLLVTAYGEFLNGAPNSACYPYLGCDAGFFGYDALEHFLFGLTAVGAIIWLCERFPNYSILRGNRLEMGLVLISLVCFIAVLWEIGECFRDAYLLDIAHIRLLDLRLHINYLAQPSNFDTMGDLSFTLLGSAISLLLLLL